jgi:toxin ParE1/3/4
MKVVFTSAARADLEEILAYTAANYPSVAVQLEERIRSARERISRWPEAGRQLEERPDIRVVPLIRFPFRIFYRLAAERVDILHIHPAYSDALIMSGTVGPGVCNRHRYPYGSTGRCWQFHAQSARQHCRGA